jgi:AraC-like DNA-binding protein
MGAGGTDVRSGAGPEPLAAHPLARSTSAAVVREAVNSLTAEQHLLVPHQGRSIDGTVNGLRVDAVSMVYVAYGTGVTIVSPPSGQRAVLVIPRGPMLVQSGGNKWVATTPFALSSHHQTKMVPDPGRGAVIGAVDTAVLERHLSAFSQRLLVRPISLSSSVPLQLVRSSMVTHTWLDACAELDRDTAPQDPGWIENVLLATMAAGLAPFLEPSFAPLPEHGIPPYVELACRYFERNLSGAVSLDVVAAAVGISTRQLHAAFRHHLGQTPAQVLRDMRLARARRQLEAPASTRISVAAAAHDAGFSHLGRFSAYYTRKYQESPSATIQRVRSEAKNPGQQ